MLRRFAFLYLLILLLGLAIGFSPTLAAGSRAEVPLSDIFDSRVPLPQVFYRDQGYSQLVKAIAELAEGLSNQKNEGGREHTLNIASIFMAQILTAHPEYLPKYAADFSGLSLYEQAIFLRGLRSAQIEGDSARDISDPRLLGLVEDSHLIFLSDLADFEVKEGGDLDYLWVSFFATGNKAYIRQVIEVLNKDDEILFVAYEWINRQKIAEMLSSLGKRTAPDFSDLRRHIHKQSRKRKDYQNQFDIAITALWSLEANSTQDPAIRQAIQEIVTEESGLNYWQKISTALGK